MKKIIISALSVITLGGIIFISCGKKNDPNAIAPGYVTDGMATGANPNLNNVTTTGNVATTSVANQSTFLPSIGQGSGWLSGTCTSSPLKIVATSSKPGMLVTVEFTSAPTQGGPYTLVSTAAANGPGKAFMTITNPTGQPIGTNWFSSGGTVTVAVTGTGITVTFLNIVCFQSGSVFPSVTATGQVACT